MLGIDKIASQSASTPKPKTPIEKRRGAFLAPVRIKTPKSRRDSTTEPKKISLLDDLIRKDPSLVISANPRSFVNSVEHTKNTAESLKIDNDSKPSAIAMNDTSFLNTQLSHMRINMILNLAVYRLRLALRDYRAYLNAVQSSILVEAFSPWPDWQIEVAVICLDRIVNMEEFHLVLASLSSENHRFEFFRRAGYLRAWNPRHPQGCYELQLKYHDNRIVARAMATLVVLEPKNGWKKMTYDGPPYNERAKDQFKLSPSWLQSIPNKGNLCFTFIDNSEPELPCDLLARFATSGAALTRTCQLNEQDEKSIELDRESFSSDTTLITKQLQTSNFKSFASLVAFVNATTALARNKKEKRNKALNNLGVPQDASIDHSIETESDTHDDTLETSVIQQMSLLRISTSNRKEKAVPNPDEDLHVTQMDVHSPTQIDVEKAQSPQSMEKSAQAIQSKKRRSSVSIPTATFIHSPSEKTTNFEDVKNQIARDLFVLKTMAGTFDAMDWVIIVICITCIYFKKNKMEPHEYTISSV